LYLDQAHALKLRIGKNLISIEKAEQLDPQRETLYRVRLAPSPCEPELPRNVIIKQRKEGWENEFETEEKVYQQLQDLQGTRIPRFFGRILFRGVPSLVLSQVEGSTLDVIAQNNSYITEAKTLESQLRKAFSDLSEKNALYWDLKLDNFIVRDDGSIVIIDLEQVKITKEPKPWEKTMNEGNVHYLMKQFERVRGRHAT
jgi:serine/threonine protein kinase